MVGFSGRSKWFTKTVDAFEEYFFVLLSSVSPLIAAIFLLFVLDWWKLNFLDQADNLREYFCFFIWNPVFGALLFVVLTVVGSVGQAKDTASLKEKNEIMKSDIVNLTNQRDDLKQQNSKLEQKIRLEVESNVQLKLELLESFKRSAHIWTCLVFNELALTVKHRISVYYLDEDKKSLVILDRFSKNDKLNKYGRSFFPRSQGVIGKALDDGEFFDKNIPPSNAGRKNNTLYYTHLKNKYKIEKDVAQKLRMKSRTICGFAVEDTHGHHIGVVIFESLDPNDFDDERLREIMKRENHRLVGFISDTLTRDAGYFAHDDSVEQGEDDEQKVA